MQVPASPAGVETTSVSCWLLMFQESTSCWLLIFLIFDDMKLAVIAEGNREIVVILFYLRQHADRRKRLYLPLDGIIVQLDGNQAEIVAAHLSPVEHRIAAGQFPSVAIIRMQLEYEIFILVSGLTFVHIEADILLAAMALTV